jgi:linoleoyl-CoA desaturase
VRIATAADRAFAQDLARAVAGHFDARGLSPKATPAMVVKTVVMLVWTAGTYALILAPGLPWSARWAACVAFGFGLAGMGMSIGHDALHGAYSRRPWLNRLLGCTFDVMGASSYIWRFTHNIAHHSYTNVEGLDLDIDYDPILRMSPATPRRWFHRWQSWYAFLLYLLAGLHWVYVKDLKYFARRTLGPSRNLRHPWTAWAGFLAGRVGVLAYTIVVPLLVLDPAWWQLAIGYLTAHMVAGATLALVFQVAHAVEGPAMTPSSPEGGPSDAFHAHQLRTTANVACDNRLLSWYVGGLNFQVEHHLFPQICSVHYPVLRPIVRELAVRHRLPYHEFPTMTSALRSHARHLRRLGRHPR